MPAARDPTALTPDSIRGHWLREVWASSIGKKIVVAITGLILALYIVVHAAANLKVFQGVGEGSGGPAIDRYAEWLRTVGEPGIPREGILWAVRVILILALVLHVTGVIQLYRRNRAARPPEGRSVARIQRSLAARTMLVTGLLLLAFVVFHVLQFTTRTIDVTPLHEGTVYLNLYEAFQEWYVVLIYVAAVIGLGFHLWHAIWSAAQTWGADKPNRNPTIRRFAAGTAIVVTVGFAAVPICFWTDVLPEPGGAELAAAGDAEAR